MRRETWIAAMIAGTSFVAVLAGLQIREQRLAAELPELPPLTGQAIRVRMLTPEGQPVPDCKANLWEPLPDGSLKMQPGAQSDCVNGVLHYPKVDAGVYRLQAASQGLSLVDERVELKQGQSVDLGDRTLQVAATLRGEVRSNGVAVTGARVRLDEQFYDNPVDPKGGFRVPVALGTHTLTAAFGSQRGSAQVAVTAEGENFVVIELQGGEEQGTLGLQIEPVPEGQKVRALHPKGPASAVLSVGEVLVSADGVSLKGMDLNAAALALSGPAGSQVTVVNSAGEEKQLTRASRSILD